MKEGHANFPSLLEDLHARLQVLAGQGPTDDDSNDSTYEEAATLLEPAKKSKAATKRKTQAARAQARTHQSGPMLQPRQLLTTRRAATFQPT